MMPINRFIDHAILAPELTRDEAASAIELGLRYRVRTVCVRPCDIAQALRLCQGSDTGVGTVLAFPYGTSLGASKADEARRHIDLGAAEIDMVLNYSLLRSGLEQAALEDIQAVSAVTVPAGVVLKVILEVSALSDRQIARGTELAVQAGAQFVKTSTGFGPSGASEQAVGTMVSAAAGRIGVKASGGIRDRAAAQKFIDLGCERIGVGYKTTPVICEGAS